MTDHIPTPASRRTSDEGFADAYRLFHDLPFIGMAVTSPGTKRWLKANQTLCDMLGYPHDVLIQMSWAELTHPDDLASDVDEFDRVMRGETDGYKLDKRYIRANGDVIHASIDVKAIRSANGAVDYFVATVADITARVAAESAARESAALLKKLSEQVPGVIYQFQLRPDGTSFFPFVSDGMLALSGVSPEQLRENAQPLFDHVHPDDLARVSASVRESAELLTPWQCDYRVVLPGQGVRWRMGSAQPERLADGSTLWHGFITDSTERQMQVESLRVSDAAMSNAMTGIMISDPDARPTYVNPAFVKMWGYDDASEILGVDIATLLPQDKNVAASVIAALDATGSWQGEIAARRKDGTTFDALVAANAVRDDSGNLLHLMSSVLDITHAKQLQAQVVHAQKMESVGRLAGGIAHDFNNLLTIMKGGLELALGRVHDDGALRVELLEISRAANSAASLTQQLLAFSRKQVISPRVLDLGDVVQSLSGMLQRVLGEDIELQVMTAPTSTVRFDPGQAEQILVNLAVNARDAMPNGGRLTLETSHVVLDEDYARTHRGVQAGAFVLLAVSDTGHGMSEETLANAFEPFFTTKDVGSGTGLGLAMIHGAVSQNGGRVEVYSERDIGTSFKIYLPRVADLVSVQAPGPRRELPRGDETLIVVEDEPAVRALVTKVLTRQGYHVHAFEYGADAIAWVRDSDAPVQLLLTDVIMPEMNGKELAEAITALRPGIRVIYASGYTANVVVQHGVLKPGVEFLAKPFAASDLANRVRELLDTRVPEHPSDHAH